MIRTPTLGIINHHDAPEPQMIVVRFGSCESPKWAYIAEGHRRGITHKMHGPDTFTPLSAFGIEASLTPDGRLSLHQMRLSIATYPDGTARRWRGPSSTVIRLNDYMAGKVMHAVRQDFRRRQGGEARASA